ncbi:MAG TPA: DUF2934 domain-containing protein [Rhodoferax sp.]|nr:DUF2934 domain-containing protein [Rhodoferax sp.]
MVTAKKSPAKKTVAAPVTAPATAVAPKAATKAAPSAALKKAPAKAAISKVKATPSAVRPEVSPEQRHNYIEVAAFYVAQRRGFAPGNPLDDWATAEIEVDQLIVSGHFSR